MLYPFMGVAVLVVVAEVSATVCASYYVCNDDVDKDDDVLQNADQVALAVVAVVLSAKTQLG